MFGKKQTFVRAKDNKPETKDVKYDSRLVRYGSKKSLAVTVVDTPGLNEDDVQDFKHMIQIVSALSHQEDMEISACILVVKFDAKIDAQYRATVRYYRDLLPQLFEKNVIIVMTMVDTSDRGKRERDLRGIDFESMKQNVVKEIMEGGKLVFKPMLFTINGLPLSEEGFENDLRERDTILNYISSLTPISANKIRVAKTRGLRNEDEKRVFEINGEIVGYNNKLKELHKKAGEAFDDVTIKKKRAGERESQLKILKSDLKELDSADEIVVKTWSFSTEWSLFQWISEKFDVNAACKITNIVKWTNGRSDWKDLHQYYNGIKGVLEGNFNRGLYAELRLETTKRIKYAEDIKSIQAQISTTEKELREANDHLVHLERSNSMYKKEIKNLEMYIQEASKKKEVYQQVYMTIEEACQRLNEWSHGNDVCFIKTSTL